MVEVEGSPEVRKEERISALPSWRMMAQERGGEVLPTTTPAVQSSCHDSFTGVSRTTAVLSRLTSSQGGKGQEESEGSLFFGTVPFSLHRI